MNFYPFIGPHDFSLKRMVKSGGHDVGQAGVFKVFDEFDQVKSAVAKYCTLDPTPEVELYQKLGYYRCYTAKRSDRLRREMKEDLINAAP